MTAASGIVVGEGYWCYQCQEMIMDGCTTCESVWPSPGYKHDTVPVLIVRKAEGA